MSKYFDREEVIKRLLHEYQKFGKILVAYDFDDTVFNSDDGTSNEDIVELIIEIRPYTHLIVYTARYYGSHDVYNDIRDGAGFVVDWLKANNVSYDTINKNVVYISVEGRKVYYDAFLDDKAGLKETYETLKEFLNRVR